MESLRKFIKASNCVLIREVSGIFHTEDTDLASLVSCHGLRQVQKGFHHPLPLLRTGAYSLSQVAVTTDLQPGKCGHDQVGAGGPICAPGSPL